MSGVRTPPIGDRGLAQPTVDAARFREVMSLFATGVTAVCARGDDGSPIGLAVNSFCSVSLDPPLVSFCVARSSTTWAELQRSSTFAVSFLAADQAELCHQMSRKGVDRFAGIGWDEAPSGAPVIDGALGWVDCSAHARHPAGDHEIVIGHVEALGVDADATRPLLFFRSSFIAV
jgi:3-hydroxy-9,10-secoandrosta-1,3,5(10)-triene-9,17-dione monooxygenase reductase component